MRDDGHISGYRVAVLTLDHHAAGPVARSADALAADFPGLHVSIHAAAEFAENPEALEVARDAILHADIIICTILFLEEHVEALLPEMRARREDCDAFVGLISDRAIVQLTKMGDLDMSKPASAAMRLMKRLRGSAKPSANSGAKQMKVLRRLPKILKLIPGKAQDLRAWFLSMQYWLGGSDDNIREMIRFLVARYARNPEWACVRAEAPVDYPDVGLYHPDLPDHGITEDLADLPRDEARPTVGLLLLRSYILAGDTAHYDGVIRAYEAKGMNVVAAFAGGLDGRPAIEAYHAGRIDALVSLTGFSLIGGPAYNDSDAAVETLAELDVPYIAAHPLEFQTLGQWALSAQGLGP
ncbi:MAG: DUF3479 domain-containing protein, partial [Pseudomonadota bacterium]